MRVSYLELYNEELCDLLSTDDTVKIRIFDDSTKKGSVIVQGLEEIPVHSKDDVYKLLAKGQERRRTASTLMNAQSSRSHTVFSILVHIKEVDTNGEEMLKIGKLNLVDLAGSENISKAGNERGIRTRETVNINQSLLTLGRVITALVERTPHIPYRESKLTRLLQESLGGRTKTSIIATISPGHKDLEETLSTLDYAHRAKNIQNRPEINQRLTKKAVLKEYTEEIDKLKRDLMAARDKNGIYLAQESYEDMVYKIETSNKELNDKHMMIKALKDELASKTKLFNEVSYNLIERTNELKETESKLKDTETDLHHTKKSLSKTKRRYNEKKVILSQHMKTEETLTKQARDLIEQAELASADTESLHATIERRKQVENEIQSTCNTFSSKLQQELTTMNASLTTFSEKYAKQSKFIQSEINSAAKSHEKMNVTLSDQIKTIKKTIDDGINDRQTLLTFNFKQIDDKMTFNREETINLITKIHENHDLHLQKMTNLTRNCVEMFEKQQNEWRKTQNELLSVMREKDSLVTAFTREIRDSITNFSKESRSEFDTNFQKTQNGIVSQESELQSIRTTLSQFFTSMSGMIDRVDANLKEVKQGTTGLEQNQRKIDSKFESLGRDMTSHVDSYQLLVEKETKIDEKLEKHASDTQNVNTKHVSSVQDAVESVTNDVKCVLSDLSSNISSSVQYVKDTLTAQNQDLTELDKKFNVSTSEKLMESENLMQKCGSCVNSVATNATSLLNCLCKDITTHTSDTKTKLLKISDETEKFRRNEIKVYQPTGMTPARKEYRIVRDLAATSPHDRIIRKFTLEGNASDLDSSIVSEVSFFLMKNL